MLQLLWVLKKNAFRETQCESAWQARVYSNIHSWKSFSLINLCLENTISITLNCCNSEFPRSCSPVGLVLPFPLRAPRTATELCTKGIVLWHGFIPVGCGPMPVSCKGQQSRCSGRISSDCVCADLGRVTCWEQRLITQTPCPTDPLRRAVLSAQPIQVFHRTISGLYRISGTVTSPVDKWRNVITSRISHVKTLAGLIPSMEL